MLQGDSKYVKKGKVIVSNVMKTAFEYAKTVLTEEEHVSDYTLI